MEPIFSDRIADVPKSFIREILKVAINKNVISFAGGLPNRDLFPVEDLQKATNNVFELYGSDSLQYSNSEGLLELREYISNWYKSEYEMNINVNNILITNGSQQGLDLIAKTFISEKDDIIIEEPGYLGAIQAFSVFRATFHPVKLNNDGLDINMLDQVIKTADSKIIYCVPNFQNPSGISYSYKKRQEVASKIKGKKIYLVEDNPYGELNYSGRKNVSFKKLVPEQTILLGTFSKTIVPSFRIGWIIAPDEIMERLLVAKQAADLHTNSFTQMIVYQYLINFNIKRHIEKIRDLYGKQLNAMLKNINKYFPDEVEFTKPEGGMFMWITLPEGFSTIKLFELAIKQNVAFVPGYPFYIGRKDTNTLRLNFSCSDEETIEEGIKRLSIAIKEILSNN